MFARNKKINVAIILSAGLGLRFKKNTNNPPKQLAKVAGKTLLEHTLEKFEKNEKINEIILVVNQDSKKIQEKIIKENDFKKVKKIILGGTTRQESSRNGIFACDVKRTEKILIHDVTRPLVSNEIINKIVTALDVYKAVTVAIHLTDTLLKVNKNSFIIDIPKRSQFMREQTPQGFDYKIIKKAHRLAIKENFNEITDDCGLIKRYKLSNIFVIQGEEENIKITYPNDIHIADKLFQIKNFPEEEKK
jgi:2-C-methyl-D-erythritol 4-phosphate cytidylyltransferase